MPELLLVKRLYEHKIGLQNDEVLPGQDIAVDRLHRPSSHLLCHGGDLRQRVQRVLERRNGCYGNQ